MLSIFERHDDTTGANLFMYKTKYSLMENFKHYTPQKRENNDDNVAGSTIQYICGDGEWMNMLRD